MKKLFLFLVSILLFVSTSIASPFEKHRVYLYNTERIPGWIEIYTIDGDQLFSGIVESQEVVKLYLLIGKYKVCMQFLDGSEQKKCFIHELKEEDCNKEGIVPYWHMIK